MSPQMILAAYRQGIFPMAASDSGVIGWYRPDPRGIILPNRFKLSKSLAQTVRASRFSVFIDRSFEKVIRACANRESTWISEEIIESYSILADLGSAHSVECWRNNELVGGLYGVSIGGAFFGESMFHLERDASKVAMVHLCLRLQEQGFLLLDAQYSTQHLEQFGLVSVSARWYEELLQRAINQDINWA